MAFFSCAPYYWMCFGLLFVRNVTNFLVEPKTLAEFLQKKLAASASLYAPPGSKAVNAVCVQVCIRPRFLLCD